MATNSDSDLLLESFGGGDEDDDKVGEVVLLNIPGQRDIDKIIDKRMAMTTTSGSDLLLEPFGGGDDHDDKIGKVVLLNIPGQRVLFPESNGPAEFFWLNFMQYVLGSLYPGAREGEEFVFCRYPYPYQRDLLDADAEHDPIHCVITVDKQGQFWIDNYRDSNKDQSKAKWRRFAYKIFVNSVRVLTPCILKFGDTISLEGRRGGAHDVFQVKEGIIRRNNFQMKETETTESVCNSMNELKLDGEDPESPLDNDLILSKIMSFLPVPDLKKARLVSKKWNNEASKVLEKKGTVSFSFGFGVDYLDPEQSTKVFRYLHEMRDLKLRNLHIRLEPRPSRTPIQSWFVFGFGAISLGDEFLNPFSSGEPGHKMMDDLSILLKSSHNFSTLFLEADIRKESDFLPFHLIFQELGEKLVELKLKLYNDVFPEGFPFPPFPLMTNLTKFTDIGSSSVDERWVSFLVPLFSNSLEHFSCLKCYKAEVYFQAFLKQPFPKLRGIAIENGPLTQKGLSLLLQLKVPLHLLKIKYHGNNDNRSVGDRQLLERLLSKNSKSLQTLVLSISHSHQGSKEEITVKFPSFPNLEELHLKLDWTTGISWETTSLDYEEHFPSLRKLVIVPPKQLQWQKQSLDLFKPFFPEDVDGEAGVRCKTVEDLWVHVLPHPADLDYGRAVRDFQPLRDRIREMFPNALRTNFSTIKPDWGM